MNIEATKHNRRVLVIIPAYNEQDCIVSTVQSVIDAGFDYIVVNDGSTDATKPLCDQCGFNVLDLPQNLGIGGCVQAGHKYALAHGYDIDVQFDGDGQHESSHIASLIKTIDNGADLAIGSRFLDKTDGFKSTMMRRLGISWLSSWIRIFTGTKVTDPTSGFRASGRRAIELFCDSYPTDYPEPESIVLALRSGLSVNEVSVLMHERQGGSSSIGVLSSMYYMIKVSLAIAITSFAQTSNRA